MVKISLRLARLMSALLLGTLATLSAADPTIIYLSRHAEKESSGSDPALTAQGQLRAQNIAATLKKVGIQAVYSTAYVRTQQTAAATANALSLSVQTYDATQLATLATQLKAAHQTAYVVGHSDTTPELIRQLGGNPGSAIDESEFDRLYQVIIADNGNVTTVLLTSLPAAVACNTVTLSRNNLSAALNSWSYFSIEVPECANTLSVTTSGGTGDGDLYVRYGAQPTATTNTCRSEKSANAEACSITNPQAGTWYIGIKAYKAFSGVTLNANATP